MSERCPICKKVLVEAMRPTRPFCSARCRTIDLGRWLNEDYRVPVEEEDATLPEEEASERKRRSDAN
jgi:endogenous inhibitor of DNA gyrase (YacG/DUF329 family)